MSLYLDIAGCEAGVHRLEIQEDAAAFGFPPEELAIRGPIDVALRVTRDGSMIVIAGLVGLVVERTCDRCLSDFQHQVEVEFREVFHLVDRVPFPEEPAAEQEIHFVDRRSTRIDLAPVIREKVLLDLPMKTLCREECRGLCPICGANRNLDPCRCESGPVDPRWESLRRLGDV